MNIRMDVERLIQAAGEFDYLSEQLHAARREIKEGVGKGAHFGSLLKNSGTHHDTFIGQMDDAISTGIETAREFHQTLVAIARDHGAVDEDIRDVLRGQEKMIEQERGT